MPDKIGPWCQDADTSGDPEHTWCDKDWCECICHQDRKVKSFAEWLTMLATTVQDLQNRLRIVEGKLHEQEKRDGGPGVPTRGRGR